MTALLALTATAWRAFRLYALALAIVLPVAPKGELAARAIAYVATVDPPLFEDDTTGDLTEAVLLANARQESTFNVDAVGKAGEVGLMQIWKGSAAMRDPVTNVRESLRQLRISYAMAPRCPFCAYLGGPRGIASARVRRLSAHREALAASVLRDMTGPDLSAAVSVRP